MTIWQAKGESDARVAEIKSDTRTQTAPAFTDENLNPQASTFTNADFAGATISAIGNTAQPAHITCNCLFLDSKHSDGCDQYESIQEIIEYIEDHVIPHFKMAVKFKNPDSEFELGIYKRNISFLESLCHPPKTQQQEE
jgi:hypothetical protein